MKMPFTQKEINELWEFCMSRKIILTISDLKVWLRREILRATIE